MVAETRRLREVELGAQELPARPRWGRLPRSIPPFAIVCPPRTPLCVALRTSAGGHRPHHPDPSPERRPGQHRPAGVRSASCGPRGHPYWPVRQKRAAPPQLGGPPCRGLRGRPQGRRSLCSHVGGGTPPSTTTGRCPRPLAAGPGHPPPSLPLSRSSCETLHKSRLLLGIRRCGPN